jgi:hypothetical protein
MLDSIDTFMARVAKLPKLKLIALGLTLIMGITFLAMQAYDYLSLVSEHGFGNADPPRRGLKVVPDEPPQDTDRPNTHAHASTVPAPRRVENGISSPSDGLDTQPHHRQQV